MTSIWFELGIVGSRYSLDSNTRFSSSVNSDTEGLLRSTNPQLDARGIKKKSVNIYPEYHQHVYLQSK